VRYPSPVRPVRGSWGQETGCNVARPYAVSIALQMPARLIFSQALRESDEHGKAPERGRRYRGTFVAGSRPPSGPSRRAGSSARRRTGRTVARPEGRETGRCVRGAGQGIGSLRGQASGLTVVRERRKDAVAGLREQGQWTKEGRTRRDSPANWPLLIMPQKRYKFRQ
jgi:hypothetical protein